MSTTALIDTGDSASLTPLIELEQQVPSHVKKHLVKGSVALGAAVSVERGMGFLANILAARLGGAATFGAYSLAISTANNISTYAGGGIGSTAARFSGKYQRGGAGYSTLARALAVVSLFSAMIAAGGLWLGAAPIARLLHKAALTGLLRWTAISAVGIILLECARGFFIGQSRLMALVLLSVVVGTGMVALIPFAATSHNPIRMIVLQGAITSSAVVVCFALARPLGLLAPHASGALPLLPMLKEVWTFGFIQLAGLIGVNFAGWWLTTLVARADTTLVQMSFFAIASQLRNIAGLGPSLLTESSYAVMADPEGKSRTPHHVMALCTFASTFAALLVAGAGILIAPWALHLVYGPAYAGAAMTVVIALCVAVVHMGNAPAAARLSIVSIRALGAINTAWAVFVALAATVFLLHGGNAWRAMVIYLAGHMLSSAMVLLLLSRKDHIPEGMGQVFGVGTAAATMLAVLAALRILDPGHALVLTASMAVLYAAAMAWLWLAGRRYHWLPDPVAVHRVVVSMLEPMHRLLRRGGSYGA